MAESVRAAGSIVGIVAFGMQLATTMHTYMETVDEADQKLRDIVFDVNATASALKQLDVIIEKDRANEAGLTVLKEDGIRDIEHLASKCRQIYQNIITLLRKASGDNEEPEESSSSQLAFNPALLKALNMRQKLKWPWLVPRIGRCHDELRWLKISLLLTLQTVNLAHLQLSRTERHDSVTHETSVRDALEALQHRRSEVTGTILMRDTKGFPTRSGSKATELRASASMKDEESNNETSDMKLYEELVLLSEIPRVQDAELESSVETLAPSFSASCSSSRPEKRKAIEMEAESSPAPMATLMLVAAPATVFPKLQKDTPIWWPHDYSDSASAEELGHQAKLSGSMANSSLQQWPLASKSSSIAHLHRLPRHILKWASRIFGKNTSKKDEYFEGTIEAYIIDDNDDGNPVRVPFSEDILKQGLKKVQKESVWSRYLALNQSNRSTLNQVMDSMRDTKDLKRTCVAFKQCAEKGQSRCTVVFFAVERKIVNFEDWRGYLFVLPFSRCKQFVDMEILVQDIYRIPDDDETRSGADMYIEHERHYTLTTKNAIPMRRTNWDVPLSIGCYIKMKMIMASPIPSKITPYSYSELSASGQSEALSSLSSVSIIDKRNAFYERERVFLTGTPKRRGRVASHPKRVTPPKRQRAAKLESEKFGRNTLNGRGRSYAKGAKKSALSSTPIPSQDWSERCRGPVTTLSLSPSKLKRVDRRQEEREVEDKKRHDEKYEKEEAYDERDSSLDGYLDVLDLDQLIRGQTSTVESMLARITNSAGAEETHLG